MDIENRKNRLCVGDSDYPMKPSVVGVSCIYDVIKLPTRHSTICRKSHKKITAKNRWSVCLDISSSTFVAMKGSMKNLCAPPTQLDSVGRTLFVYKRMRDADYNRYAVK